MVTRCHINEGVEADFALHTPLIDALSLTCTRSIRPHGVATDRRRRGVDGGDASGHEDGALADEGGRMAAVDPPQLAERAVEHGMEQRGVQLRRLRGHDVVVVEGRDLHARAEATRARRRLEHGLRPRIGGKTAVIREGFEVAERCVRDGGATLRAGRVLPRACDRILALGEGVPGSPEGALYKGPYHPLV